MNYPDFVATIRQENTPPGAATTIKWWKDNSIPDSFSNPTILDLACSTGYSGRTFCKNTDYKVFGIDISEDAITVAQEKAGINSFQYEYRVGDACNLDFKNEFFTHILGGCNFAFIQDRELALRESSRVLHPEGFLLTANFHYVYRPPEALLDKVSDAIGFRASSTWNKEFWDNLMNKFFELKSEHNCLLRVMSNEEIEEICIRQIELANLQITQAKKDEYCKRLIETRKVLNEQRKYQQYTVAAWKKHHII